MSWLETHKQHLIYSGAAALAVWLAGFTYNHVRSGQEAAANAALAALSKPADRSGKQPQPLAADYLKVAEQHAGTKAGVRATLFGADRLFTEGKFPEAKVHFEKYLAANPTGPAAAAAWHAAGIAHGGTTCEDPPGVREGSLGKMYLAYLRDPSGNKICALHRMG